MSIVISGNDNGWFLNTHCVLGTVISNFHLFIHWNLIKVL